MRRLTLTTIAILLATTAPASAAKWYIEDPGAKHGERTIVQTPHTEVPVTGSWLLRVRAAGKHQRVHKYECQVTGTDALTNTGTSATDELRALTFLTCPAGVEAHIASGWTGVLEGDGAPFTEPLGTISIEVTSPTATGLFTGQLTALYGDFDPPAHEGKYDDIDNTFKLTGQSGTLTDETGASLQIAAREKYGQPGARADGQLNGEPEHIGGEPGGE